MSAQPNSVLTVTLTGKEWVDLLLTMRDRMSNVSCFLTDVMVKILCAEFLLDEVEENEKWTATLPHVAWQHIDSHLWRHIESPTIPKVIEQLARQEMQLNSSDWN